MKKHLIIALYLIVNQLCFSQSFPYKLNRTSPERTVFGETFPLGTLLPCERNVKVSDERPSNCVFDNQFYMYPVFIENFDYKEELPNNFGFTVNYNQYDDQYGKDGPPNTLLEGAYQNNNVYTDGGIGYLEWKKETKTGTNGKTYDYTGAFLSSLFGLRQGVFEARIKLPDYPLWFPAYWLYEHQEIDIFEFQDGNIKKNNTCDTYHDMKVHIHGYVNGEHCSRNRKFGVPPTFFQSYHTYKCVWTDYKVDIYLDGTLVAHTAKYYDGPFHPGGVCHTHVYGAMVPSYHRSCNYMSVTPECRIRIWRPNFPDFWNGHYECLDYNKVKKDESFPVTTTPMKLIISNSLAGISDEALTTLSSAWSGLSIDKKRIGIDWIKIYQPIDCSAPRYVCSIGDYRAITGNTNFLSGSVIQMGNGSSCGLVNHEYDKFPIHLLAADEIQFFGDMSFDEDTYLRAEIIDCSGGFNQYQRTADNGEKLFLTDEEIEEIEKRQNDSLMIFDSAFRDSILAYNELQNQYKLIETKSMLDNGAIHIFPNPTEKVLYIDMADEDFYDLFEIEIIDNLGKVYLIQKSKEVDVDFLHSGFYQIKFKFSSGFVVAKSFIKK